MLPKPNVAGGSQERTGREWKTGRGDWYLVFSNVGETWNSAQQRKKNVLSKAFQSSVAWTSPVTCSLRWSPRFCSALKGLWPGKMAPLHWSPPRFWNTMNSSHFNTKNCYTHFNVLVYNHSKEKQKRVNSKTWQSFFFHSITAKNGISSETMKFHPRIQVLREEQWWNSRVETASQF